MKSTTYILGTGNKGSERLDFQNNFIKPLAYKHLEEAGLSEGKIVFDIGCGNGAMTTYLAKIVGANGHVYGVDISKNQLDLAKERIESENLKNVTFIQADINSPENLPQNTADIVYMRFVLMHMQNPENGVNSVKRILKPGGVIASMESMVNAMQNSTESTVIKEFYYILLKLGEYNKVDYNLGKRSQSLFENEGFTIVASEFKDSLMSYIEGKKFFLLSIAEWKEKAVEAKIISYEEIENLIERIKNLPDTDEDCFYPTSAFIIAKNN